MKLAAKTGDFVLVHDLADLSSDENQRLAGRYYSHESIVALWKLNRNSEVYCIYFRFSLLLFLISRLWLIALL